MPSHTHTHHVHRLEVVHTGRRRRWTLAEKIRIVEESLVGHRQASATARRHDIPTSLLFSWRKAYRKGRLGMDMPAVGFVEARVIPDAAMSPTRAPDGRIEIIAHGGRRLIVGPDVDPAALAKVLAVLEGR